METPDDLHSITNRIREGLSRLSVIARHDDWEQAKRVGLNPTQLAILNLLTARVEGMGVQAIARHLALSQPTVTDSILALERKSLVEKRPGADKRAVIIRVSEEGRQAASAADGAASALTAAVDALSGKQQENLLLLLVQMIRHLQESDAIPVQPMCATCRYFAPFAHPEGERPHHCHYVNAAFGSRDIRIDCREHVTADPATRAATWAVFQKG